MGAKIMDYDDNLDRCFKCEKIITLQDDVTEIIDKELHCEFCAIEEKENEE